MKNLTYTFSLFMLFVINNSHAQYDANSLNINSLNVNTAHSEFGFTPYADGFLFASNKNANAKTPFYDLFYKNTKTNKVRYFSTMLDTPLNQCSVVFTSDLNTVYFTGNIAPFEKFNKRSKEQLTLKIYKADFVKGSYKNVQELPFSSSSYSIAFPALSPDGTKLYFSSDMPGGYGASDIYVVNINADGSFSEPKNLGEKINTKGRDNHPFVGQDNMLYFSSDGRNGMGGLDIYKYDLVFDSAVLLLGNGINSVKDDFAFSIAEDNKYARFTSNRKNNNDDIYQINLQNQIIQNQDIKKPTTLSVVYD